MSSLSQVAIACFVVVLMLAGCSQRDTVVFCDDRAELLSGPQRDRLNGFHQKLLEDVDIHLLVVVLDRLERDLDGKSVAIFEKYRVGSETNGARGVLLVVDPFGRQVRMEIGYDLEGTFPDGFVAMVEKEQMSPFFAAGRVADGIEATVELLVAKALNLETSQALIPSAKERLSGGGGARINVNIGTGNAQPSSQPGPSQKYSAGASPQETLSSYLQVLNSRNKDPELQIYTPETRNMLRKWLVTDAQQASELKTLSAAVGRGNWRIEGSLAVLRFPLAERQLPPYFFQQSEQEWMLDLTTMSQLVAFNHLNQWHFRHLEHPYMFAFQDVLFDANGYPHPATKKP
ncbi:MAG: TPM domain-containing protein [Desulfuromonadales bacterium]|nr:TPM domain-containing protein [Desulfuromonadales bacterium]